MNPRNRTRCLVAALVLSMAPQCGWGSRTEVDFINIRYKWSDRSANTTFTDVHDNPVSLSKTPDLTLEGISEVSVHQRADRSTVLVLFFNEGGAEKMSEFVRGTVGIFADGQLLSTFLILQPQTTLPERIEKIEIAVPLSKRRAEAIAARANKWIAKSKTYPQR